jgi:release factor glutamine methyltransferase
LEFERPLDEEEVVRVRELVRRRATGEPVAYITGEKEFYGRAFRVTPDTLIPRPETELIVEHVLGLAKATNREQLRVLDLGTGSGCIGITLAAELPGAVVVITDISEGALEAGQENAQRHDVTGRVAVLRSSWWNAVDAEQEFDIVVSNPPYICTAEMAALPRDVGEFEPTTALDGGTDGLDAYREICDGLGARQPSLVALEVDPNRATEVAALVEQLHPETVTTHKDLAGRERLVLGQWAGR